MNVNTELVAPNLEHLTQASSGGLAGPPEQESRLGIELATVLRVARHPLAFLDAAAERSLLRALHTLRARVEAPMLCEACREARSRDACSPEHRNHRHERPAPRPGETEVRLGPHHVDHHPIPGGIRVHPAPVIRPGSDLHPRGALRHH